MTQSVATVATAICLLRASSPAVNPAQANSARTGAMNTIVRVESG
jgi:hypothetical protein